MIYWQSLCSIPHQIGSFLSEKINEDDNDNNDENHGDDSGNILLQPSLTPATCKHKPTHAVHRF